MTPSLGCRGSCPDCCLWSRTLNQTCVKERSSCCCSGYCWPPSHPAKSQHPSHHLHHQTQKTICICEFNYTPYFEEQLPTLTGESLIDIKESARVSISLPFLSLLRATTLGWLMEISMSGGLISAIFISSSSDDSSSES